MPQGRFKTLRLLVCALTSLFLTSCFGSNSAPVVDAGQQQQGTAAKPAGQQDQAEQQRNVLSTSMPALARLAPGVEFDFVVAADFKDPLFQASTRVLYDSRKVELVSAQRGGLVPDGAIFMARTDVARGALPVPESAAAAGMDSVVPAAFTGLPGDHAASPARGELLRLRFRLLAPTGNAGAPVRLQGDPDFLQLRDSSGRRLPFDIESKVGVN
jgi:hypothetical protein